jgi:hypothetical protein
MAAKTEALEAKAGANLLPEIRALRGTFSSGSSFGYMCVSKKLNVT